MTDASGDALIDKFPFELAITGVGFLLLNSTMYENDE